MSPTTRCKFVVDEITTGRSGTPTKMKFAAVYPDANDDYKHGEDHAFFNATPYGFIELHIQNAHAAELFQPGDTWYVDFVKVPKPEPATV
jgi:hypothetical protein